MRFFLLSTFVFLFISSNHASIPYLRKKVQGRHHFISKQFLKKQKRFSKALCRPGIEQKYWKLVKDFRGAGFYIPRTLDGKLDRATIKKYLDELQRKVDWLALEVKNIKNKESFRIQLRETGVFNSDLKKLLLLKERYYDSKDIKQKKYLIKESKEEYDSFRLRVRSFLKTVPYFHSYSFPVDHLHLRTQYDRYKGLQDPQKKKRANEIYFYRKIVQDGSHDKNYRSPDLSLRAMIDTLYLKLDKSHSLIPEEIRHDLEDVLKRMERQMKKGVANLKFRLNSWYKRSVSARDFYHSLYKGKVVIDGVALEATEYVKNNNLAREALKKFVLEQEAKTYKFWKREPELYRSLFVLTTILFNEVGRVDGHDALERLDVLDIVMNRFESPKYNYIGKRDHIYQYLDLSDKELKRFPWLNVLFKEGEFSFTYYFITGSLRIFCPEMTRSGKRLRAKNLSLALRQLKYSQKRFEGIRYFSRASMLGRIDMSGLWSDYKAIKERPGRLIKNPINLLKRYKKGDYRYLYHFEDEHGDLYKVVEIGKSNYTLEMKTRRFYTYRNPHYFKYFKSLKR